ncbi:hypothetical protein [Tateyamaria pelophila]|nr:hypothetical protein [Tateyamaria pelophila]
MGDLIDAMAMQDAERIRAACARNASLACGAGTARAQAIADAEKPNDRR